MQTITKKHLNQLTYDVVGAAIDVHKELGPGLLESVYHKCMKHELSLRGVQFTSGQSVNIEYKGLALDSELRYDLLIEGVFVVELKTVEFFAPVHVAQLLTYMKLIKAPKGILLNFYCFNLYKEGQKTYVNELFGSLAEK